MDALANNSLAISAAINNTQGGDTDGYTLALLVLTVDFVSAPTAGTACSVWLLRSGDGGSTYEDGGTSTTPARTFDGQLPLLASTAAQTVSCIVQLPPGYFKVLLKNDGTGQAFPSSGSLLKLTPYTSELV
jgi:hypothetical protein